MRPKYEPGSESLHGLGIGVRVLLHPGEGLTVWPEWFARTRLDAPTAPPAQCVGQHIPLDVQGAILALVFRQLKNNLSPLGDFVIGQLVQGLGRRVEG